jgi:hypothetical protein
MRKSAHSTALLLVCFVSTKKPLRGTKKERKEREKREKERKEKKGNVCFVSTKKPQRGKREERKEKKRLLSNAKNAIQLLMEKTERERD